MSANILIVDDSPVSIVYLEDILQDSGYKVFSAVNGKEGLSCVENDDIDLIISDYKMPEMGGVDFCKAVKSIEPANNIYFIIFSSFDTSESTVAGLDIGADDYLSKKISPEELLARVRAGLRIRQLNEQLKEANLSLFQTEKLASIGQLAAGVAHEINNPIGYVTSNVKTLKDYFKDIVEYLEGLDNIIINKCPDVADRALKLRQKHDIDYITEDVDTLITESLDGSSRVKKIVQDLKNFARIDKDGIHDSSIKELIESTLNIIWNDLKYKAEIIKHYDKENLIINCNSQEINQVLVNLLMNASQAIEGRGEITIKTWQDKKYANISITDTGNGISKENLTRLYDPFFTTKPVGQGTGLGLSIVYDIIQKHNGKLLVDSKVGEGTTFTVRLPLADEH